MWLGSSLFTIALFVVAIIVISRAIRVVPQQHALVIERLGRFYAVLQPGLTLVIPFIDRVAYRHDLREIRPTFLSQICIRRTTRSCRSTGSSTFRSPTRSSRRTARATFQIAITQLAQTTLRSVIGAWSSTGRSRSATTSTVLSSRRSIRAADWGVKVLRYEIKDLTPPKETARDAGADHRRAREARGDRDLRGKQREQINLANGARAAIAKSGGEEAGRRSTRHKGSAAILAIAEANAKRSARSPKSIESPGGIQAVNPQGRRAVRRRVREHREDQQYGHRSRQSRRSRGARDVGDDGVQGAATIERAGIGKRNSEMQIEGNTFIVTGGASGWERRLRACSSVEAGKVVIADLSEKARQRACRRAWRQRSVCPAPMSPTKRARKAAVGARSRATAVRRDSSIAPESSSARRSSARKARTRSRPSLARSTSISSDLQRDAARGRRDGEGTPNADGERGVIVFHIVDRGIRDARSGRSAYSASKAGLVGMTLPIARELARYGIRAVTIAPGVFETPMVGQVPPEVAEALGRRSFPPRLGRPAEFASLVRGSSATRC